MSISFRGITLDSWIILEFCVPSLFSPPFLCLRKYGKVHTAHVDKCNILTGRNRRMTWGASPGGTRAQNLPAKKETQVSSWRSGRSLEEERAPTQASLPGGASHRLRSLGGLQAAGLQKSRTTQGNKIPATEAWLTALKCTVQGSPGGLAGPLRGHRFRPTSGELRPHVLPSVVRRH